LDPIRNVPLAIAVVAPGRRRVAILNEERTRLPVLSKRLSELGYDAVVCGASVQEAGRACLQIEPTVALLGRRGSDEDTLVLLKALTGLGAFPIVILLPHPDPSYVREAARRGASAYVVGSSKDELQSSINLAAERFSQSRHLQQAFTRRVVVEQAKGILMARHGLDERAAFELLRAHARRSSRRLVSVAEALIECHQLLPAEHPHPDRARR